MTDQTDSQPEPSAEPAPSTSNAPSTDPGAPANADLAALAKERDALYDRLLRTTAEFDNYRKRIDRERRDQASESVAQVLRDVLPVVDDFERALAIDAQQDPVAYGKGVELIHTKLQDLLRRYGVAPVESVGRDFDPTVHQAVLYEESDAHRDGEVIGELQRGYRIGERLLRAAMVKVAKA